MALSTYAELQAAIADHLDRSGLDSQIPDFIRIAEARMQRKLRVQPMESIFTSDSAAPVALGGIDYFLAAKSVAVYYGSEYRILNYIPPAVYWARYGSQETGDPLEYTLISNLLYVGSVPSGTPAWRIIYYSQLPPLSTFGTSWLLTRHPDVYLYGSLIAAEMYLKDPQELTKYIAMYEQGLREIQQEEIMDRPRGTAAQFNEMGAV